MKIQVIEFGMFRLDGGAMFGSVPKNLWSKLIPVDEENCIPLASRSLLIEVDNKKILIDVGLGDKWDEKSKKIFAINTTDRKTLPFKDEEITDVILTHLHFDHAGGISKYKPGTTEVERVYPHAIIYLQKSNYERALAPSLRERASYLKENVTIIDPKKDVLLPDNSTILQGADWKIIGHKIDGHTAGQQWLEVIGSKHLLFATDLIPTSRHLPLPYHMGYDLCAETVMNEKEEFLKHAIKHDAIVVFQHDPDTGFPQAFSSKQQAYADHATLQ